MNMDQTLRALARDPASAMAIYQLGIGLRDKRLPDRAKTLLNRASLLEPSNTRYLADLLYTAHFAGDQSAIPQLQQLAVSGLSPHPARLLGLLYAEIKRPEDASRESKRSITLDPGNVISYSKRAITSVVARDRTSAKKSLNVALILDPEWLEARINYAYLLESEGYYRQALTYYLSIIKDAPDLPEPYFNASICYLALGNFQEGWKWYHHRWLVNSIVSFGADHRLRRLNSSKPEFKGGFVPRLLIWREQGLGDEIMFASIVRDAMRRAAKVLLTCDPRLQRLFARSFSEVEVLGSPFAISESLYDAQISIGGLAKIFRSDKNQFSSRAPYLKADPVKVREFQKILRPFKRKIVGISWRSINVDNGSERSIPLRELLSLSGLPPISWVNLQYDFARTEVSVASTLSDSSDNQFFEFPDVDKMNDLDAVAALICACDLVISIGNSVAHLAGALGKPVIVLVPTAGSWRWTASGTSTPWYSSAEVIRKEPNEGWEAVNKRLVHAVRFYLE